MRRELRHAFGAVFRYEIRQGLRSPAWWLLVLNFGLPALVVSASPWDPWVPFNRRLFTPILLTLGFTLVVPFVVLVVLEREDVPRLYDLFWIRLPHVGGGLLGKAMASLVLVVLAVAPVAIWVLGVALFYHGWDGWRGWWEGALFLFSGLSVYFALSLLVWLLVPHRFGARVFGLFLMSGLLLLQDRFSVLHLWAPLSRGHFDLMTGLVPFRDLFWWHRIFWLFLALGATLWALAWGARRARRPLSPRERDWVRSLQYVGVAVVLLALVPALLYAREKGQRFYEMEGPSTILLSQSPADVCPQRYRVTVSFDLRRLQLQGHALWQGADRPPQLQEGLTATSAEEGAWIRMDYQGSPRWPRQVLWCPECLRAGASLAQRPFQPYPLGWYFVEGHLFLLMSGAWHPFPGCPMERLAVHLEHLPCEHCTAVTGSPETQIGEVAQEFVWEAPPGQGPLLTVATSYRSFERAGRHFLLPRHLFPRRVQDDLVAVHGMVVDRMAWNGLLAEGEARTLAVAAKLTYPRWNPEGLILVPTKILVRRGAQGIDEGHYQRDVALALLMGWWCQGRVSCVEEMAAGLLERQAMPTSLPIDLPMDEIERFVQGAQAPRAGVPQSEPMMLANLLLYGAYRLQDPDSAYQLRALSFSGALAHPLLLERSHPVLNVLDALYREDSVRFWRILLAYRNTYGVEDVPLTEFDKWVEREFGLTLPDPEVSSP